MGEVLAGSPLLMNEDELRNALEAAEAALARARGAIEHTGSAEREELPLLASKAFQQRRRRDLAFPPGTFAEYEWDMLLVLCMKAHSQPELRQIDLFNAAGVPHTTGLRMIERLEAAGLIVRRPGGTTLRKRLVALTGDGLQRLGRALRHSGGFEA